MNHLRSTIVRHKAWGRFVTYAIPVAIITVSVIAMLATLVVLTTRVNQQIDTGTELLGMNLSDQTRTFVQLQRETLKMLIEVTRPVDELDLDAAELQYQLVQSRVNHMNRASVEAATPSEVIANIETLNDMWEPLQISIETWLADPTDADLRENVSNELIEFERVANTSEIEFNRGRMRTLSDFANTSRQIPITFGIATAAMFTLILAILYVVYRYIREIQEAEAARQSSQLKDQFLAVMSHELRTPLNAIIGFLGIIGMTENLPDRVVHMVERSRSNAERLLTLIDDVLDISKIEAGRFEIHPEAIQFRKLIDDWKSQMEVLASQKGLEFTVNVNESLPEHILVDSDALTKIVTNLLSNAFKFTEKGSVRLDVYAVQDVLTIRVTDSGMGIPLSKQAEVFESFRQVDGSTRRKHGGTGLGLSIVKQLTHLLNGEITLKSQLNEGSTFTVTLPLQVPDTNSEKPILPVQTGSPEERINAYSK